MLKGKIPWRIERLGGAFLALSPYGDRVGYFDKLVVSPHQYQFSYKGETIAVLNKGAHSFPAEYKQMFPELIIISKG